MHKIFTPFAAILAAMMLTSATSILTSAHHQYKKRVTEQCATAPIMSPLADWCVEQQMLPNDITPQYRYQAVLEEWI